MTLFNADKRASMPRTVIGRQRMKILAGGFCLLAVLAASSAQAQQMAAPVTTASAPITPDGCPGFSMAPPKYPPEAYRAGRTGTTLISIVLDTCGRVSDVRVSKSSGSKVLDDAAVAAAKSWVFRAPTAEAVDGHIELPVSFDLRSGPPPSDKKMGWPSTHKRPRYVLEGPSAELPSMEVVKDLIRPLPERVYPIPYTGVSGNFISVGTAASPEFWLLPALDGRVDVAARYRPVMENGEPVVYLLIVCDKEPVVCAKDQSFLIKGLPFAKAKR